MSKFLISVLIITSVLIVVGLIVGVWAYRYYTAETRGKIGAREQIQSSSSRISGYNHFFNLCASIQGHEGALDSIAYWKICMVGELFPEDKYPSNLPIEIHELGQRALYAVRDQDIDTAKNIWKQ